MTLDAGSILANRFELVREVGRGSMGKVWLATHLTLGVRCAVKFMTSEAMGHPDYAARFALEARAIAHLNSPNIVRVLDYDVDDGVPFIAMEWLQGEDLGARIQRAGRLDPAVTHRILSQVACGLEKAHAAGIVHRDLKPENIFLAEEDEGEIAKLLDFGIAKRISFGSGGEVTRVPRAPELVGTPAYMSPEQVAGFEVDHRADLWSLAVVAFECLTGQLPFRADSLADLFATIQRAPLPVPSRIDPSCPPELDRWWARAASRSLPARFSSASALTHALARALGVIEPRPGAPSVPARPTMRRSGLVAAILALALAPLAGMFLTERIDGHARSRPSSAPGGHGEAAGDGSPARPSMPAPVELVGLPDLPEAATRGPAGPVPMRAAATGVDANAAARARRLSCLRRPLGRLRAQPIPKQLLRGRTTWTSDSDDAPCRLPLGDAVRFAASPSRRVPPARAVAARPSGSRPGRSRSHPTWDRATARALAREGYEAQQRRQYALAADRFERAEALVHAPTLLLGLARAQQGLGELVEAQEDLPATHARAAADRCAPGVRQGRRGGEARGPARRDAARVGDARRARAIGQRSHRGAGHGRRSLRFRRRRSASGARAIRERTSRGPSPPASAPRSIPLP